MIIQVSLLLFLLLQILFSEAQAVTVNYYGHKLVLKQVVWNPAACTSSAIITKELAKVKELHSQNFIRLDSFVQANQLDGIGVYLLLNKVGAAYKFDNARTALFSYAYLDKKYDVILSYTKSNILGIGYYSDMKFSREWSLVEQKIYYRLNSNEALKVHYRYKPEILTSGTKKLNFCGIPKLPTGEVIVKTFTFKNTKGDTETLELKVSANAIAYYLDIPKILDYEQYTLAKPSDVFAASLKKTIENKLNSLNEVEKVEYLLSFVQSLPYFTLDGKGEDRFMFPEETVFYEKSDCEDRSFLLGYLIIQATSTVPYIIDYDDHVNIGLKCSAFGSGFTPDLTKQLEGECYFTAETTNDAKLGKNSEEGIKFSRVIPCSRNETQ